MADDHSLQPGTRLGHYRITKVLGRGGFGITYQAFDGNLNRHVAIKEYFPNGQAVRAPDGVRIISSATDAAGYRKGLDRFLEEARTLAQFRDPRIVHVHGFNEANNTAYMVMDFEDGYSLKDHVKSKGSLGPREARSVLTDILRGLQVIHARNYLHRDIKPANIMRRPDASILLLDFGSARQSLADQEQAFTVMVTPGYAPMEQYTQSETQGPSTDLYSTGACLLFCMTGSSPPDAMKRTIAEQSQQTDPLDQFVKVIASRDPLGAELAEILAWMMKTQARHRPQTAAEVLKRLDKLTATTSSANLADPSLDDPHMNTLVVPPTQYIAPKPVDLSTVKSIPSALVEPIRLKLEALVGGRATQILFTAIRQAKSAQHLVDNIASQIEEETQRLRAIEAVTQMLLSSAKPAGPVGEGVPTQQGVTQTRATVAPAGMTRTTVTTSDPISATRATVSVADDETTMNITKELAKYIGPIAKMVVKKGLAKASTRKDLLAQLEQEIAVEADRTAFRKAVLKLKAFAE